MPYEKDFCQANANKFYTKAECEEYCGKPEVDGEKKKICNRNWRCAHLCTLGPMERLFFLIFQIQSSWLQIDGNEDLFQLWISEQPAQRKFQFVKFEGHIWTYFTLINKSTIIVRTDNDYLLLNVHDLCISSHLCYRFHEIVYFPAL